MDEVQQLEQIPEDQPETQVESQTTEDVSQDTEIEDLQAQAEPAYSFTHKGRTVNLTAEEIEKIYNDYYNDKSWKTKNQQKSTELKKLRESLEREKAELEKRRAKLVEDEKAVQQLSERRQELDFVNQQRINAECQLAIAEALRDEVNYPDFNYDRIVEFAKKYNFDNNPRDRLRILYLAERGSRIQEIIDKVKLELFIQARNKKGLPPTGKPGIEPPEKIDDYDALREKFIKLGL